MDRYEKQITDYVADLTYQELSPEAVLSAKERFLDSLAVSLAAYRSPPAVAMRTLALGVSSQKGATVLGTAHRAPLDYAAVYLGTLIRALDWNDTYLNKEPAHPSDNLPACLVVAEAENRSGEDLILSAVLSYELHCRLCDAAGIRKKGWDHVTYGSISSTVGAARLMNFSRKQIRDALAIAITTGNYLRQTRIGSISQWKASAFAQSCQNAVRATLYVKHGMDGPSDIFEGQHGFLNQIVQGEFDLAERFGGQGGEAFKIVDTYIKYFPAEYHSQSAIWAALDLRKRIGAENVPNISKIHIETSFHSYEIIGKEPAKWKPETRETADHSLPYIVSAALLDGEITLRQFDEKHLRDPRLRELIGKVTVAEKPEYTHIYGKSFPSRVTVTLCSGEVFEKEILDPRGHPNNPLSREELENKFRQSAELILDNKQQDRLIEMIWNLEKVENVGELMKLFEVE